MDNSLFSALAAGDGAQAQELFAGGADVNGCDEAGRSPLMVAAGYGLADCVALLLERGADVNLQAEEGETALMGAAGSGNLAIVEILIGAGANSTLMDQSGTTAMEYAAIKGHGDVVRYFRDTQPMNSEAIRRSRFVAEVFDHPQVVAILTP